MKINVARFARNVVKRNLLVIRRNFFEAESLNIVFTFFLFYRNRVAVQLQKNLDRVRLRRVAAKMKKVTLGGYTISSHPSGMIFGTKNMREVTPSSDEDESSR